ncbi:helix-turn-helix transcriptional regulator [Roseovarius rhodophyticola]|uniref:LuxR C-terminal-related transcriptional regulator n=1 Tax=Roseovarius rhodophyticola TaxID=3080827 RepID=A0ABZ2TF03_9RHOB|nr:LuxR C-terminal-related transcriptional regulator [Roseovarius sp. W115]MDV2928546.1 LuxR C-terminal-related transcriptional regulator [Roseovarius sp. W115]
MEQTRSELQELSDLIGVVYDSALEPKQWQQLLVTLNQKFQGFMGAVYTQEGEKFIGMYNPDGFNTASQEVYDKHTKDGKVHGIGEDQNDHRRELLKRIDPQIGDVYYSREIFTDEEFRSSTSYKTVLEPAGIGHWVSLKFAQSGLREAVFIFFENEKSNDTPDPEALKQVFELISPHVVRATRIARALRMAKEASETFQGFLDAIALPMLVTDREARLVFSNAAGQRLLDRDALFRTNASGQLMLSDPRNTSAVYRQIEGLAQNNVPAGLRLEEHDGPVSLCIAPFHPSMADAGEADQDLYDARRLYAIFVGSLGDEPVNTGLLRDVFELTQREAEICSAVVAGQSPSEIAAATGRAEKTVRNQIQAVYEKVGVNSAQSLNDALSVFKTVGAIFNVEDKHMFELRN